VFRACVLLLLAGALARPLAAQQPPAPHVIRWYEAGGALAGVLALMLVDEPVQRFAQRSRSAASNDIAAVVRHVGQPEVYVTVPLALIGVGLIADKPEITKAGGRAAASLALAAAVELSLKVVIGRARPDSGLGSSHFDSFSFTARSMPSGHSALSFALATSLAGEVRSHWARAGLYGLATATALSRVNDDRHWLSDIVAGSVIGFTSAKLVGGRWQVFGIEPPRFLVAADGMSVVGVRIEF
jgi:membrane-associated phospholipid phosphatase